MPRPKKDENDKKGVSASIRVSIAERQMMKEVIEDFNKEMPASEAAVTVYLYKKEHKRRKL